MNADDVVKEHPDTSVSPSRQPAHGGVVCFISGFVREGRSQLAIDGAPGWFVIDGCLYFGDIELPS